MSLAAPRKFNPFTTEPKGCSQLELSLYPEEVVVDGMADPKCPDIQYWGKATRSNDGIWRCLAQIGAALVIVEVNILLLIPLQKQP